MFKRILSELARVLVADGRSPDLPTLNDLPRTAFDDAAIERESAFSRLRDCAGMRAARSRRRVWRLREVRREMLVRPAPRR